jgi:hypothetical protein
MDSSSPSKPHELGLKILAPIPSRPGNRAIPISRMSFYSADAGDDSSDE